jgi:hypothetical protein
LDVCSVLNPRCLDTDEYYFSEQPLDPFYAKISGKELQLNTAPPPLSFHPPLRYQDDAEVGIIPDQKKFYEKESSTPPERSDFWGREYYFPGDDESSTATVMLPTYFCVDAKGNTKIMSDLHPVFLRSEFGPAYTQLETLFMKALPLIESVYGYCRAVRRNVRTDKRCEPSLGVSIEPPPFAHNEWAPLSLKESHLQVVTAIYDQYSTDDLVSESTIAGIPDEEIVATAIYVLDRDECFKEGDIMLSRAFYKGEARYVESNLGGIQGRPLLKDSRLKEAFLPLGKMCTKEHRLMVFPNTHRWCMSPLVFPPRKDSGEPTMRFLCFYLINPQKRIPSTLETPAASVGLAKALEIASSDREYRQSNKDWNCRPMELYTD